MKSPTNKYSFDMNQLSPENISFYCAKPKIKEVGEFIEEMVYKFTNNRKMNLTLG